MSSANDAAVALAERVSGSVEAFQSDLYDEAARLNMADNPVLLDPAGLDDSFSVGGGNRISASDLAIAARALLADPELSGIVAENIARFTGGDGIAHRLVNHNNMIRHYQGTIGVKTGWTVKAGHCLIAAARRDGRTMLSVVMDAPDMYATSAALLDRGFNTPVGSESTMSHLPPVPTDTPHASAKGKAKANAAKSAATNAVPPGAAALTTPVEASARHSGRWGNLLINLIGAAALALAVLRARVRWVRRRRRHARLGHVPARPKVRTPRSAPASRVPTPQPQPAPPPVVIQPVAGLWEGRTLEEWDRPLVSR
jgi:D-alanyl-D-alanine carboxypeptidase